MINNFDYHYHGQDWGWFPDPNAMVGMSYDANNRKLYIYREEIGVKHDNEMWESRINDLKNFTIVADGNEQKTINDFKSWGYDMRSAIKGPNSVHEGMKWLAGLNEIIIDPRRCPYAFNEFTSYEYVKDKKVILLQHMLMIKTIPLHLLGMLWKLCGVEEVYNNKGEINMVGKVLAKLNKGYKELNNSSWVELWNYWYRGNVTGFHDYIIYNGKNNIQAKLKTLQMAKKVSEDWADLLFNEKCDIVLPNEEANDIFNNILDDNNFYVKGNESVEQSFALGYGMLVIGVENLYFGDKGTIDKKNSKITIDFVNRFNIRPLTIKNKIITEAVFIVNNSDSTDYIIHLLNDDGFYDIHNYRVIKESIYLINVFETKSKIAWFQMIRPFISSNLTFGNIEVEPYISIYANSLDILKSIDSKYDSFDNEFIAGRKRLFASDELFNVHNKLDGATIKTFNPMSTTIHMLPSSSNNAGQYIEDKSGALRANEHIDAINMDLNLLSSKTGLGESFYRFDGSGFSTATQIVSENSKLFRTLKKHEILLESTLRKLTIAIIEASNNHTNNKINIAVENYGDIRFVFDDSIIEDKGTEMERDKNLVSSGIMSKIEFREKWLAEDYDTAVDNYRKYFKYDIMNQYLPALIQGAMTPKEFILEVYGVENAETEKYITEKLATQDYDGFIDQMYGDTDA